MEWADFLVASELNNSSHPPDGRYLFGKILHDTLECLNSYQAYVDLMQKLPGFPPPAHHWFTTKSPIMAALLVQITPLGRYYQELPETSERWPVLIEKVGRIISEADSLLFELEGLTLPTDKFEQDIAKAAIRYIKTLKLLSEDIQAKKYKRLWSIRKYKSLPETQA